MAAMTSARLALRLSSRDQSTRLLIALLVLGCVSVAVSLYANRGIALVTQGRFFSDFAAQWSFGRFAAAGRGSEIYDANALHQFQLAQTGVEHDYPYPYPPFFLLMLWPIGMVRSFAVAYLVWVGVTFALYALASCGGRRRGAMLALLAIAPASTVSVFVGQNGFLFAALLIGGLRCATNRPMLSGILFGLLSFKPHLGLLVPVALLAAGAWRPIVGALATLVVLVALSSLVFGLELWRQWLLAILEHGAAVEAGGSVQPYMPTVTINLLMMGLDPRIAHGVQVCIAAVVAGLTWRCCRRGVAGFPPPLAAAVVEIGSFLVTPYAFFYDMPMTTNAVLSYLGAKNRQDLPLGLIEVTILLLTFTLPLVLAVCSPHLPYGATVLLLCLGLLCRLNWRSPSSRRSGE
jgi:hypothetical protein